MRKIKHYFSSIYILLAAFHIGVGANTVIVGDWDSYWVLAGLMFLILSRLDDEKRHD